MSLFPICFCDYRLSSLIVYQVYSILKRKLGNMSSTGTTCMRPEFVVLERRYVCVVCPFMCLVCAWCVSISMCAYV